MILTQYGNDQLEIYFDGLKGKIPKLPVNFDEREKRAHAAISAGLVSCVAGGCGNEHTQRLDVSAFARWGLIPRMLVGAANRYLSVNLFGMKFPTPIFMAV